MKNCEAFQGKKLSLRKTKLMPSSNATFRFIERMNHRWSHRGKGSVSAFIKWQWHCGKSGNFITSHGTSFLPNKAQILSYSRESILAQQPGGPVLHSNSAGCLGSFRFSPTATLHCRSSRGRGTLSCSPPPNSGWRDYYEGTPDFRSLMGILRSCLLKAVSYNHFL